MNNLQFLSRKQSLVVPIFFALLLAMSVSLISKAESIAPTIAPITGEWSGELSKKRPEYVQMTFSRRSNNGDFNNWSGDDILIRELQRPRRFAN